MKVFYQRLCPLLLTLAPLRPFVIAQDMLGERKFRLRVLSNCNNLRKPRKFQNMVVRSNGLYCLGPLTPEGLAKR
jgi:hypothetical protein